MNLTGLAPEITEYISRLETQLQVHSKTVESQQVRIDQLCRFPSYLAVEFQDSLTVGSKHF